MQKRKVELARPLDDKNRIVLPKECIEALRLNKMDGERKICFSITEDGVLIRRVK